MTITIGAWITPFIAIFIVAMKFAIEEQDFMGPLMGTIVCWTLLGMARWLP